MIPASLKSGMNATVKKNIGMPEARPAVRMRSLLCTTSSKSEPTGVVGSVKARLRSMTRTAGRMPGSMELPKPFSSRKERFVLPQ